MAVYYLSSAPGLHAADHFRTDINPALLYYQAFLEQPSLSDDDRRHVFEKEWRGVPLDTRFKDLMPRYDAVFKLLNQASLAKVPCEWGIDLGDGPNALLPGLARAKAAAQVARMRVMWHLAAGRPDAARSELVNTFHLARNVSKGGLIISALVDHAMENILISIVAENYHHFGTETLRQIVEGFNQSPPRSTIAQAVESERAGFFGWFRQQVDDFRKEADGNDSVAMAKFRELSDRTLAMTQSDSSEQMVKDPTFTDKLVKVAGGTTDGVIRLLDEYSRMLDRVKAIMQMPLAQYEVEIKAFGELVAKHPNPVIWSLCRVFEKPRPKEFVCEMRLAMLTAALQYRINGAAGVKSVNDPCGNGPFQFQRFTFNGVDRGFELKSPYMGRGLREVLIFVEKDGPAFRVDGKRAGEPVASPTGSQ